VDLVCAVLVKKRRESKLSLDHIFVKKIAFEKKSDKCTSGTHETRFSQ